MERSSGILSLPDSVLQTILFDLGARRKLELQRVCRRFLDIMPFSKVVMGNLPRYVFECMSPEYDFCPAQVVLFKGLLDDECTDSRGLDTVYINAARFLSRTFPQMRSLVLTNCSFELNALQFLPSLKGLGVRDAKIQSFMEGNEGRALSVLRNMAWFHVEYGMTMHEPLGCFRKLTVQGWEKVQQGDVEWMDIYLPKLRVLDVRGCRLSWISEAFHLKRLVISDGSVDEDVLPKAISKSLLYLKLQWWRSDRGYAFHCHMKSLKALVIRNSNLGSSDLENLMHFRCLTDVDLSYTGALTDDLLDILRKCGYPIRTLGAKTNSEIGFSTPAVVRYLEWWTCLEQLGIPGHRRVTDQIFSGAGHFPETLTRLAIARTGCPRDLENLESTWNLEISLENMENLEF